MLACQNHPMWLSKLTSESSMTSCCCALPPVSVSFEGPVLFLLPFLTFWRLRCFWASDAVCSLAARHEVWCRERPWQCLNFLLHPLQVVIIMIMKRNMIFVAIIVLLPWIVDLEAGLNERKSKASHDLDVDRFSVVAKRLQKDSDYKIDILHDTTSTVQGLS